MKSKLFAAAIALAAPFAARAADTGSELAFRTGFSFPFGHFTGAPPGFSPVSVSDLFYGFVPLGVEAGYRFTPNVYAGLVFQYGWLSFSQSQPGFEFDLRMNGFEFVHLDVGADFVASPNMRIGPFLQFKLAQFRDSNSGEIMDRALHEFLTLGVRASFLP